MQFTLSLLTFILLTSFLIGNEENSIDLDDSYKPLKLDLNEDSSQYLRFIIWNQFWSTSNNISDDISNSWKFQHANFSLRRSRFLALAQVSDRF